MATIIQRPNGSWQAKVRRAGLPPLSKTFPKKAEAEAWARGLEHQMDVGSFVSSEAAEAMSFAVAAGKYETKILPSKRGADQDRYRIRALVKELGGYSLAALSMSPAILASLRDRRLAVVSPQSVVHDLNMVRRILKAAELDFGVTLPRGLPLVRKPRVDNARDRRFFPGEEEYINKALGKQRNQAIVVAFILAVETAGRQSELLSLEWRFVDLQRKVARLRGVDGRETKNTERYREVPLSSRAVAVLAKTPEAERKGLVLNLTSDATKQAWARAVEGARREYVRATLIARLMAEAGMTEAEARAEATKLAPRGGPKRHRGAPAEAASQIFAELQEDPMLQDFRFHDLRHEATSRLAEKFQIHELMKITGHKSTTMLARYYHPRAEDLAKRLD